MTSSRQLSTTLKQRCVFQRRFSQRWATSKQRREYDHLKKKIKPRFKSKIIFLSFKEYAGLKIFFHFTPFLEEFVKE